MAAESCHISNILETHSHLPMSISHIPVRDMPPIPGRCGHTPMKILFVFCRNNLILIMTVYFQSSSRLKSRMRSLYPANLNMKFLSSRKVIFESLGVEKSRTDSRDFTVLKNSLIKVKHENRQHRLLAPKILRFFCTTIGS